MKPVSAAEIASLDHYARLRPAWREKLVAHKRDRRLPIGDHVTLVFEDHETLRFQIQEMVWIERIADPVKVQEEIDVYNELMPGENELSATLFIEITDLPEVRPELDRLVGIDEHVSLRLGNAGEVRARFDTKQLEEERISAVQYIRFALEPEQARRLADTSQPAAIRIDHPNYRREAELPEALRESLGRNLVDATEPLARLDAAQSVADAEASVLFEGDGLRAVRPAHPRAPQHIVVEPIEPGPTLLDADPELLGALMHALQRAASDVVRACGSCRIESEFRPEQPTLRWHVLGPGR